MRHRLLWKVGSSYIVLLLLALAVVYLYMVRVVERNFVASTFDRLEGIISLAEGRPPNVEDPAELADWTQWMARSGTRITVIASDGVVLADSDERPERMENHASRPEIRQAFMSGRGRANRYSNTVRRDLVYLAVRYDWGTSPPVVLRVAEPLVRIEQAIAEVRGPVGSVILALFAVGGVVSFLFSRNLAQRVRRLQEQYSRIADGDFRPAPLTGGDDELTELGVSMNEMAARLDATIRSLREERDQGATILSAMAEGVAVVGPDAHILYLNRSFRNALVLGGESWEEFRGKALSDIVDENELVALTEAALKGAKGEIELQVKTTPPRSVLARAAPVSAESEAGAVLVLLDLTELHRLERVRRDFVANVSHELKTPLTAVQGFAETLLGGALEDPENSRRFLEIIRHHAVRLSRLTDDLLKLSRIEAGKQEPEVQELRLGLLIEPLIETARLKAEPKSITISFVSHDQNDAIRGDAHWLSEVFQNLLDNAIQYTGDGGAVRVVAEVDSDFASVRFEDNGIGIPQENQSRIFERFYRVDPARSREVGGTGLGLAITKHLVESLGGRIELTSEPGQGSTFIVILPRV